MIILPGAVIAVIHSIRRRNWGILAATAWLFGYLCLYAWRLPVTYQHGRYVIPAMPVFFLLGLMELVEFQLRNARRTDRLLRTFWRMTAGATLFIFWGTGAMAYARDVAFIESEMVATAKWVSVHIPASSLVAAHDIGALGYFGDHKLVDLAGLISPEVIPFLRDEKRIATYLDSRGVGYLVIFPDWFPTLTADLVPIFSTGAPYGPAQGQLNMAVYHWSGP